MWHCAILTRGKSAMRCPYCAEEIKDEAAVCKHCHHDLHVARRLIDQIGEISKRLEVIGDTASSAGGVTADRGHYSYRQHHYPAFTALESFALAYIVLVVAHFLINVQFDLKLTYFKITSIAVPMIFGLLCRESEKRTLGTGLLLGLAIAVTAIPSMLAVMSNLTNVPFVPKDAYEWFEIAFHSVSIAFGFLTGTIIRQMLIAIYVPNAKPNKMIEWIARLIVEQFGLERKPRFNLRAIRSMVSSFIGFGSAIISIITGLWEFVK
jgi:hypothetical protein